ncbi:MAG TPA: retroviral-like aspartic protease family protein [Rhizomicrobium sp.]|nr:retroviral-like aspartic protease family protein [Rhizomicrobium sp.]
MLKQLPITLAGLIVAFSGLTDCGKSENSSHKTAADNTAPTTNHLGERDTLGIPIADPSRDAQAAYQRHDYSSALKIWLPLARRGNADAEVDVAFLYEHGQGVPQDYAEAVLWYRKAAAKGDARAQRSIGFMYDTGNGLTQNYAEARSWYLRAARQGDPRAQMLLGAMYASAEGVPQNLSAAYMWFSVAASSADAVDLPSVKYRDEAAASLTENQLAQAQELARVCQQSNYRRCGEPENTETAIPSSSVPMRNVGGIYVVPVGINDALSINFVVDSGASDVSVPADVVLTLIRTNTLSLSDFIGSQTYTLADGSTAPSKTFRIRSLKVGNIVLENVLGSVGDVESVPLLGQSFLGRFTSWSIDNGQHTLVLLNSGPPGSPSESPEPTASAPAPVESASPAGASNPPGASVQGPSAVTALQTSQQQPTDGTVITRNVSASFDCSKVHFIAESVVCNDSNLAALDNEYAAKWTSVVLDLRSKRATAEYVEVRNHARLFLKRRNECNTSAECITRAYQSIIQYLSSVRDIQP